MSVLATSSRGPTTGSLVAPATSVLLAVVALFLAALAFQTSDGEAISIAELDHRRDELALARASLHVERGVSDELVRRLLEDLGHPTVVVDDRGAAALAEVDALAVESGEVGRSARRLADAVHSSGGIEHAAVDELLDLVDVASSARTGGGDAGVDEVIAAADRVALPSRLLLGGLAAHRVAAEVATSDRPAELERMIALGVTAPLEMAQPAPGADAPLFDRLDQLHLDHGLPSLHDELERIAAGDQVRPDDGPVDLAHAAAVAGADLEVAWSSADGTLTEGFDAAEREHDLRRHRFRIAGWALIVVAGLLPVGAALLALSGRRRTRPPETAPSDAPSIPGFLEPAAFRRENARLVADPRFDQHLFAVVRVARIEMVVDAYGSAATDRVERLVTRRLQRAIAWLAGGRSDTEAVASRRRAGEYELANHSSRSIDADLVRRVLLLRSGTAIPLGSDHVPVSYTVGLHLELGRPDVDDAMDAADRATLDRTPCRDLAPRPVAAPLELVRT